MFQSRGHWFGDNGGELKKNGFLDWKIKFLGHAKKLLKITCSS